MQFTEILNIVVFVLCVIFYAVMLFFKAKGNLVGSISELIALVESSGLAGHEKMALVVSQLYEKVPAPFRVIFSEEKIQSFAQWVFDWMRKYAYAYIDTHPDNIPNPEADEKITTDMAADLISQLMNMSAEAMRQKAEEYGVHIEPEYSKDQITRAIIEAILKKS